MGRRRRWCRCGGSLRGKEGFGGAAHFANTDDTKIHVDIPNSPTLENLQEGDYTVAAWVWPNRLPPGTDVTPAYGIVVKQGSHIGLVYDQDSLFKMQHHSSAGYSLAKSAKKSPTAWYHVTGIVSKGNGFVKIYVDGKLEATVNFTRGATAREFGTETWKLGIAGPDYARFREAMNGKVDDVRIYGRVLSDGEIAVLAGTWKTPEKQESRLYSYTAASGSNLLLNPSFEDGRCDWSLLESAEVVDGSAHALAGKKCLKITVDPKLGDARRWFRIAQFWIKPKTEKQADQVKFHHIPNATTLGTTNWNEHSGTVVGPGKFNGWLQIVCFVYGCTSGETHFDDLRLERGEGFKIVVPEESHFLSIYHLTTKEHRHER